jgi:hypothetical protein
MAVPGLDPGIVPAIYESSGLCEQTALEIIETETDQRNAANATWIAGSSPAMTEAHSAKAGA